MSLESKNKLNILDKLSVAISVTCRGKIGGVLKGVMLLALLSSNVETMEASAKEKDDFKDARESFSVTSGNFKESYNIYVFDDAAPSGGDNPDRGRKVIRPPEGCVVDLKGLEKEMLNAEGFFFKEAGEFLPKNILVKVVESFPEDPNQTGNHFMQASKIERFHYVDVLTTEEISILRYRLMHEFAHCVLRESMDRETLSAGGIQDEDGICEYISYCYIQKINPDEADKILNMILSTEYAPAFKRVQASGKTVSELLNY